MKTVDQQINTLLRALGVSADDEFDLTTFKGVKGVGPSGLIQVAEALKKRKIRMVLHYRPSFKTKQEWQRFLDFYGITYVRQNVDPDQQALNAFKKLKAQGDKK
ncbi:hypothetical protein LCGC14_1493390 [marine sediment metagenome]|uniref:Uncharacterized protein n=1 Tax=marine sediment metagenome TaxID=412755 RepID=A0A0F9LLM8_9ZZZZ